MPQPSLKIQFDANLGPLRKTFREMAKLQGKTWQTRQKQMRVEQKFQRDEMKGVKDQQRRQEKMSRKEMDHIRVKRHETEALQRQEKKHTEEQARRTKGAQTQELDHAKKLRHEVSRGIFGGGLRRAITGGALFAGGGLLGLLIGAGIKGYQNLMTYHAAQGGAIGMGGGRAGAAISQARRQQGRAGYGNLGFNRVEWAGMTPMMGRATGTINPLAMAAGQRATGMQGGELADIFGTFRQAGLQFAGPTTVMGQGGQEQLVQRTDNRGKREFERVIAAGMYSGLERARLPEFFQGVSSIMQQQSQMLTGVVDPSSTARLLGVMGRFGEQIGAPGLQGARGAGLLNRVQAGILQPGGGEEGRAFMQQAMGFGVPGGTSFYAAEKMREKGLSDPENFNRVMTEMKRQSGSTEEAALRLREIFGVSLDQAEKLLALSGTSGDMAGKMKEVDTIMAESKSLEERAAEAMKQAATALTRIANRFDKTLPRGEAAAGAIEAIEDLQDKLIRMLLEWLPEIKAVLTAIADGIKIMVEGIKVIVAYIKTLWKGAGDIIDWATGASQTGQTDSQQRMSKMAKARQEKFFETLSSGNKKRRKMWGKQLQDIGEEMYGHPGTGGAAEMTRMEGFMTQMLPGLADIWEEEYGEGAFTDPYALRSFQSTVRSASYDYFKHKDMKKYKEDIRAGARAARSNVNKQLKGAEEKRKKKQTGAGTPAKSAALTAPSTESVPGEAGESGEASVNATFEAIYAPGDNIIQTPPTAKGRGGRADSSGHRSA